MHICFLAHAISIHVQRRIHYFREQGHRVSLITFTPVDPEPGIEQYALSNQQGSHYERTNWHYLLQLPQMRQIIRQIQPDILNAHFLSSYGVMGALVRPTDCPFVITLYGSDILLIPQRSAVHSWATRFALSQADLVVSASQPMTEMLPKYMSTDKPIITLQYGVNTDHFFPPESPATRVARCLSNRAPVPVGNLETVLLAASELEKQGSAIQIDMVGEGELSNSLRQKASELQLDERVDFLGRVSDEKMHELLRTDAIYISMSLSDGASLSVLEAMACGAFPVVSDIPPNREWVTDGVNGYLVPVDSPQLLAQRLQEAWDRPEFRQTVAKRNWALIQEKGSYHKNMGVIEAALRQLIQDKKNHGRR